MSQNKILKSGDLVRYKIQSNDLDDLGFILGQIYEVYSEGDSLLVRSDLGYRGREVIAVKGELTDAADYFAKHVCTVVLPRGQSC